MSNAYEVILRARNEASGALNTVERDVERLRQEVQRTGGGFGGLGNAANSLRGNLSGLGGLLGTLRAGIAGLVANSAVQGVLSLAQGAQKADSQLRIFNGTVQRMGVDGKAANDMVNRLADQFGVMPSVVQDSTTQLLRAGYSLQQIEGILKGAGASSLAFGRDAAAGFDNVTSAAVTGQSDLLNSIGISQNLSTEYQKLAKHLGKSVDSLTDAERAQATYNLVVGATQAEVGDLGTLTGGLAGQQGKLNRAVGELSNTIGRMLLPYVTQAVQWLAEVANKSLAWVKANEQYLKPGLVGLGNLIMGLGTLAVGVVRGALGVITSLGAIVGNAIGRAVAAWQDAIAALGRAWDKLKQGDFGGASGELSAGADSIKRDFEGLGDEILKTLDSTFTPVQQQLAAGWNQLAQGGTQLGQVIKDVNENGWKPAIVATTQLTTSTVKLAAATTSANGTTRTAAQLAKEHRAAIAAINDPLETLRRKYDAGTLSAGVYASGLRSLISEHLAAAGKVKQGSDAWNAHMDVVKGARSELKQLASDEKQAADEAKRRAEEARRKAEAEARAERERARNVRELTEGYQKLRDAIQQATSKGSYSGQDKTGLLNQLRDLRERAADLGLSENALVVAADRATASLVHQADGANAAAIAHKALKDGLEAGNKALSEVLSKPDEYADNWQRAREAHHQVILSLDDLLAQLPDSVDGLDSYAQAMQELASSGNITKDVLAQVLQVIQDIRDAASNAQDLADAAALDQLREGTGQARTASSYFKSYGVGAEGLQAAFADAGGIGDVLTDPEGALADLARFNKNAADTISAVYGDVVQAIVTHTKDGLETAQTELDQFYSGNAARYGNGQNAADSAIRQSYGAGDAGLRAALKDQGSDPNNFGDDPGAALADLATRNKDLAEALGRVYADALGLYTQLNSLPAVSMQDFETLSAQLDQLGPQLRDSSALADTLAEGIRRAGQSGDLSADDVERLLAQLAYLRSGFSDAVPPAEKLDTTLSDLTEGTLADLSRSLSDARSQFEIGATSSEDFGKAALSVETTLKRMRGALALLGNKDAVASIDLMTAAFENSLTPAEKAALATARAAESDKKLADEAKKSAEAQKKFSDQIGQLGGALASLAGAFGGPGGSDLQANIAGFTNLLQKGMDIAQSFASGDIVGGIAKIISAIADAISGFQKAYAEAARLRQQFADSISPLLNPDDWAKTYVRSRGILADLFGGGPEVVQEIDKFGLSLAQSIAGGVESGFKSGLKKALVSGNLNDFHSAFKESVGSGILDGMIDAFLKQEVLQTLLSEPIKAYVAALKTADPNDDVTALNGLLAATDSAMALGDKFLAGVQPVRQKLIAGGYITPEGSKDATAKTGGYGSVSVEQTQSLSSAQARVNIDLLGSFAQQLNSTLGLMRDDLRSVGAELRGAAVELRAAAVYLGQTIKGKDWGYAR